jgi:hypothetical protein
LLSPERARDVYGVRPADDAAATHALRQTMAAERGARPAFDFGPGRDAWETKFGVAAETIAAWLPSLPEGVRRHAQVEVYRRLAYIGTGPYDASATHDVIRAVAAKLPKRTVS